MFTQRAIAAAFGITPQAVTMALRGCSPSIEEVTRAEGGRSVKRRVAVYQPSDVFGLAARTGKLQQYRELCEQAGVPAATFHLVRKEVAFGDMLRRFLPDDVEIVCQHPVGGFRVDFYLPAFGICIEYDERHHASAEQTDRDTARQRMIEAGSRVLFIRIVEGAEERGLFLVAMAMMESQLS